MAVTLDLPSCPLDTEILSGLINCSPWIFVFNVHWLQLERSRHFSQIEKIHLCRLIDVLC